MKIDVGTKSTVKYALIYLYIFVYIFVCNRGRIFSHNVLKRVCHIGSISTFFRLWGVIFSRIQSHTQEEVEAEAEADEEELQQNKIELNTSPDRQRIMLWMSVMFLVALLWAFAFNNSSFLSIFPQYTRVSHFCLLAGGGWWWLVAYRINYIHKDLIIIFDFCNIQNDMNES